MRTAIRFTAITVTALVIAGCATQRQTETAVGTGAGAAAGAVLGTAIGGTGRGTVIGAAVGAYGYRVFVDSAPVLERALARDAGLRVTAIPMILEGGAVDGDGTGLVATTEQCLLNPNRNPHLTREQIEAELAEHLGFTRVLWLGDGLINDHTDGHVDNLARFVGPNRLVVPEATGKNDPNAAIYDDAAARAAKAGVEVVRIPSPGLLIRDGVVEPASYVNFAITSHLVVVPTFGSPHDAEGVAAIAALFPDRACLGLPGEAVLAGGGGFHCASQQMPAAPAP